MIKVYGMSRCPNCINALEQMKDNPAFTFIDIGVRPEDMKDFLAIRDANSIFDDVRGGKGIGIPTFVKEDGTVTRIPEEVGLKSRKI